MVKKKSNIFENPWLYLGIILLVLAAFAFWPAGSVVAGEYDDLAVCLTEKGAVMYGTEWCSFCNAQKKDFGSSFDYINFVDCDNDQESCALAGVSGYPTWVINGQNYPGKQSLDNLANLAGC